jgi:hypothetical protein
MAVIIKEIKLKGSKGEAAKGALFDSGASYSCILPALANKLAMVVLLPTPIDVSTGEEKRKFTAKEVVILDFYIDNYRFSDEFMVIDGLDQEVIIGDKTLRKWRLKLDFDNNDIIIDPRVTKLRI